MKRILLLTAVVLGAGHLLKDDAETQSAQVAAATDGDKSCCATGGLSRAAMLGATRASGATACEADDHEAAVAPFPESEMPVVPAAATRGTAYVVSDLMATPERAEHDAQLKLRQAIMGWLVPDVPADWTPPDGLVFSTVLDRRHREIDRDYAPLQQVTLQVDLSPQRRDLFRRAYLRDEGMTRMGWLGAVITFVLVILAILAGYIRTDEATKGYYTARLRMLAAAGVGAAGVVLYQVLT